jgi:MoaA/NifB/PqqE/SkfB family radical SAM enzyme
MNTSKILRGMPSSFPAEIRESNSPLYLMMNLETGCPLRCLKCAQPGQGRQTGKPLTLAQREEFIETAAQCGVKALIIIGAGEPSTPQNFTRFVRPVIESAHRHGLLTVMFTTALGINREQAVFYRDNGVTIVVSLDSLLPEQYKKLTGNGNLARVLQNIAVLREVYEETIRDESGVRTVRLGVNCTIQRPNEGELGQIRAFAGDDMLFVANAPMPAGRFAIYANWDETVGDANLDRFNQLARELSDTGGHSSLAEGACSYFNRGITVDVDGQHLSCGYAAASAEFLNNVEEPTVETMMAHYHRVRGGYQEWCQSIGRQPSCPLRDPDYQEFLLRLRR